MKKIMTLLVFLVFVTNYFAQESITTDDVSKSMGKDVVVAGTATQVKVMESKMVYINVDGEFPNNKLTGVIFKKDAGEFENIKEYEGKKIELTGKVEEYKGKPQIVLKKKNQIKLVE